MKLWTGGFGHLHRGCEERRGIHIYIFHLQTFLRSGARGILRRPIIPIPLPPAQESRRRTCLLLFIRFAFRPCFSSSSSSSSFCRRWACRVGGFAAGMAITSLWATFATTSTHAATIAMKIPTFAIICKWMRFGPRVCILIQRNRSVNDAVPFIQDGPIDD